MLIYAFKDKLYTLNHQIYCPTIPPYLYNTYHCMYLIETTLAVLIFTPICLLSAERTYIWLSCILSWLSS